MFTKKMAVAAALSLGVAAAGLSTSVFGENNTKEFTINITATVPALDLEVLLAKRKEDSQDIELQWNTGTEKFKVHTSTLGLRSNVGPIHAKLKNVAEIAYDGKKIPLTITFNEKILNTTPQEVLSAVDANLLVAKELELKIEPATPDVRMPAGKYEGIVTLMFEAIVT